MQDKYVADVGDFGKYGLLRALVGTFDSGPELRLGVIWYKVVGERENNDGSKLTYLTRERASEYSPCDPQLYRLLRDIVGERRRALGQIERSGALPPRTVYFRDEVAQFGKPARGSATERAEYRRQWFASALRELKSCNIIFADPDNGLQSSNLAACDTRAHKYALEEELIQIVRAQKTLVAYHQTCRRGTADEQIRAKLLLLRRAAGDVAGLCALRFRRGSSRALIVLPAKDHRRLVQRRIESFLASAWRHHFDLIEVGD